MSREIVECRYSITPIDDIDPQFANDPEAIWLVKQAEAHGLTTLLAHADDGVIWGQVANGKLALSGQAFSEVSPPFRAKTLQQVRLFGKKAELLIWCDGANQWLARLLDDGGTEIGGWCFDEPQLQWGDHIRCKKDGFTLVAEGQEGLRHAVPMVLADDLFKLSDWHPLRLGVHHYLARNEADGMLIIVQSRLTGLWTEGWKEGSDE